MKLIEDKEKEHRQKKQEEASLKQAEVQEKLLAEENRRGETETKKVKYQEDFLKLTVECNVNKISDLVAYQHDQTEQKRTLKQIAESEQVLTEEKKALLVRLQDQLKMLKYQASDERLHEQELEAVLRKKQQEEPDPDKRREECLLKLKKMKETIASAIMSVARVAHQLKEDTKITPHNADQKLSVCGLRLEHMVATLYKKKPTFNIESVNTDYSSDLPPAFLGIKNAIYVNPPATATEQDPEKELQKLYVEKAVVEVDEEDDFLHDEYSKHKRLARALSQQ